MPSSRSWSSTLLAALVWCVAGSGALAGPPSIVNEDRVLLRIRPVVVDQEDTVTYEERTLEIDPKEGGFLEFRMPWPPTGNLGRLALSATGRAGAAEGVQAFRLECSWTPPGEATVRSSRDFRVKPGTTTFMELYNRGGRHLTLALQAEHVLRPVLRKPDPRGIPVRFHVTVERVVDGKGVILESNDLSTLLGEDVGYAFRLGEGESLQTLDLRLRPLSIEGTLIEMEVALRGTLWVAGSPLYVDRRNRVMTSRAAATPVVAVDGDPPNGFRFQVTPLF
jgi:hypothetical protein